MLFSFYWEFDNACFIFPMDSFKYSFSQFPLERKRKRSWISSSNTSVDSPTLTEPDQVSAVSDDEDPPQIRSESEMRLLEVQKQLFKFHNNGISLSSSLERDISPIQDWNVISNVNTECSLISNNNQILVSPRCYSLNNSGSSVPSVDLVKRESPILVPPKLKRTLSLIPFSSELEHQMSVLDTKQPVTPLVSFSEQVSHQIVDNVCLSQRAFSDSQDNFLDSFNFKPLLETPKCSPKRTFKVKILKNDINDDDPEVQYICKNAIKIAEYEGKPFKMRKYHKSPSNRCGRSSKIVIVIPKTTVYSDGQPKFPYPCLQ
jgi:hypothetical protein